MKLFRYPKLMCLLACLLTTGSLQAQSLAGDDLVAALQDGGHVIVMRHASSPRELPTQESAAPGNTGLERQLDETGRNDAAAMGDALEHLMIPVDEVLSSPTYRAMETGRLIGFTDITAVEELSNEGMRAAGEEKAAWLQEQVSQSPDNGNNLLITHTPNIRAAFADHASGMEEGEALIFDPSDADDPVMLGRIKITEWVDL